ARVARIGRVSELGSALERGASAIFARRVGGCVRRAGRVGVDRARTPAVDGRGRGFGRARGLDRARRLRSVVRGARQNREKETPDERAEPRPASTHIPSSGDVHLSNVRASRSEKWITARALFEPLARGATDTLRRSNHLSALAGNTLCSE